VIKRTKIHVYTFCRDEEQILPFFLSHYSFAEKIIVFLDVHSQDNSASILEAQPNCEIIPFDLDGKYCDNFIMLAKNSQWKMSKGIADWVMVVDMDEFIYHEKDLFKFLNECKEQSVSLPLTRGYEMFSDYLPANNIELTKQIKIGLKNNRFDKQVIFDPNLIININYRPGAHRCDPEGCIKYSNFSELLLLHYKYIGGLERVVNRWNIFGANLSALNIKNNWSTERLNPEEAVRRFNRIKQNGRQVIN